jgi:LacI family transcriptional regulator
VVGQQRGNEEPGRDRVTIRQVAQAAGVSVATVSRVFAGSAAVSSDLTGRVLRAAEALGYTPNVLAQSLAIGRSKVVGILVPNLANPHFYILIKRILHEAERDGYRVIVADSDENVAAEKALGVSLLQRTDGLILGAPRARRSDLRELVDRGKPVVVVNRAVDDPALSTVVIDSFDAMRQLAVHVADLGHRNVVYLHGAAGSWQEKERARAARGLRRRGVQVTEIRCGATLEDGHRVTGQVLDTGCTAVLAPNDLAAIGVISGLTERGLRVPEDMSVTGFDDIPFSRFVSPPLTTAFTPQEDTGAAAWQVMAGLLDGKRPGTRLTIAAEPVFRASTAAPRAS